MRLLNVSALMMLLFFQYQSHAFKETHLPVLLRINPIQSDTLGFHFGSQLSKTLYKAILNGDIKLWDTREKETHISPSSLLDIETASKTRFCDAQQIFLYENWIISKNDITTTTLGVLFSTKTGGDEDVTYGFVDGRDMMTVLQNTTLSVNADGINGLSLAYVLFMHYFDFDIMQASHNVFTSKDQSNEMRIKLIGLRTFNGNLFPYPPVNKSIEYIIEKSLDLDSEMARNSDQLLKNLEAILKTTSLFDSLGGNSLLKTDKNYLNVTGVKINELWHRNAGNVISKTNWLLIYIDNMPLDTLTAEVIVSRDIKVLGTPLNMLLQNKTFNYIISKINDQDIDRSQSFIFQKALIESHWNQLNDYVNRF